MSERDAAEHTRLRTVLETIAASDAAMAVTPDAMESLERCVSAMTQAAGENDYYKSAQADLEFHREIWRMSGDRALFRVLDQVTLPLFAFVSMNRSWRHAELRNSVIEDHRVVIEALRTRDPARSAEAMRRHFQNSDARSVYSASKLLESTLLHLPKAKQYTTAVSRDGG
jgi:DNA-binding GntR family transcriptional regulator